MKREIISLSISALCVGSAIGLSYLTEEDKASKAVEVIKQLETNTSVEGVVEKEYEGYSKQVINTTHNASFKETFGFQLNRHKDKVNDDYLGSIMIPSIGTNEAVYGGVGEYYLHNDYKHNKNKVGEVYLDDRSGRELTGNGALLNGHAVPNGSKFGEFKHLLSVDKQPDIYIWDESKGKVIHYQMLFVSLIDGNNSGIIMDFESPTEQLLYYQKLHDTSIKRWERPTSYENFLVLNSCAYIINNGHYVAFAKKVGEYD